MRSRPGPRGRCPVAPREFSIRGLRTRCCPRSKVSGHDFETGPPPRAVPMLLALLGRLLEHDRAGPVNGLAEADLLGRSDARAAFREHEALDDLTEQRTLVDLRVSRE